VVFLTIYKYQGTTFVCLFDIPRVVEFGTPT
jgi:hypothetical protein